jgi:hypothetical protein
MSNNNKYTSIEQVRTSPALLHKTRNYVARKRYILTKKGKVPEGVCKPNGDENLWALDLRESDNLDDVEYILHPKPVPFRGRHDVAPQEEEPVSCQKMFEARQTHSVVIPVRRRC